MAQRGILRVAMLNTDTPVPNVHAKLGTYGSIFASLLSATAARVAPSVVFEWEEFDVVLGHYPPSLSTFSALVITGSAASSYDDAPWIHRLDEYVADVYEHQPNVKIFGSCFGHQLLCQSLLREFGVHVEKDPKGWEMGVQTISLTPEFRGAFTSGRAASDCHNPERPPTPEEMLPEKLRMQFVHSDHVKLPQGNLMPEGWDLMGSTEHCHVQGVHRPGRVLTYQGHFEFDRFVNTETLKVFGTSWKPDALARGIRSMDADDDAQLAAEIVLRFFLDGNVNGSPKVAPGRGSLPTPES
ncbi:class I glutamine amidotransferase-like protein [Xylariomycetidae sp. FL2044]|nr:class I glutamine amidotransferase-like protein [Xylariomycetidae sp. FL2044]